MLLVCYSVTIISRQSVFCDTQPGRRLRAGGSCAYCIAPNLHQKQVSILSASQLTAVLQRSCDVVICGIKRLADDGLDGPFGDAILVMGFWATEADRLSVFFDGMLERF